MKKWLNEETKKKLNMQEGVGRRKQLMEGEEGTVEGEWNLEKMVG